MVWISGIFSWKFAVSLYRGTLLRIDAIMMTSKTNGTINLPCFTLGVYLDVNLPTVRSQVSHWLGYLLWCHLQGQSSLVRHILHEHSFQTLWKGDKENYATIENLLLWGWTKNWLEWGTNDLRTNVPPIYQLSYIPALFWRSPYFVNLLFLFYDDVTKV